MSETEYDYDEEDFRKKWSTDIATYTGLLRGNKIKKIMLYPHPGDDRHDLVDDFIAALHQNNSLTELILCDANLLDRVPAFLSYLQNNRTLLKLEVTESLRGYNSQLAFVLNPLINANANRTLKSLSITSNGLGEAIINFSHMLKYNTTLTELQIASNDIQPLECLYLIEGITQNNTIRSLFINEYHLGYGTEKLLDIIAHNKSIVELELYSGISIMGVDRLKDTFANNNTIELLSINCVDKILLQHLADVFNPAVNPRYPQKIVELYLGLIGNVNTIPGALRYFKSAIVNNRRVRHLTIDTSDMEGFYSDLDDIDKIDTHIASNKLVYDDSITKCRRACCSVLSCHQFAGYGMLTSHKPLLKLIAQCVWSTRENDNWKNFN